MRKTFTTIVILVAIVATVLAAGCGIKGEKEISEQQGIFLTGHQTLQFTDNLTEIQCLTGTNGVYIFGERVSEGETQTAVYIIEFGTKEARQIAGWPKEKPLVWGTNESGKVAFITFSEEGKYVLHVISKDVEESSCFLDDALQSVREFGFFLSIAVSEDSIALADTQAGMVFVIGYSDGKLIKQIPMNDYLSYLNFTKDGMLTGISQTGTLCVMNPISGSRETVAENLFANTGVPKDCFVQEKMAWVATDTGMYFVSEEGAETRQMLEYIEYDILLEENADLFVDSSGEQWGIVTWNRDGKRIDLYRLALGNGENIDGSMDGNTTPEKEVIVLSHYMVDPHLQEIVAAFNQSSDKYRVEVVTAGDNIDWDQYMDERTMQILAGNGPDIFMATSDSRFEEYIEKGVLEDLQPYIDANLQEEAYLENALYAYRKDGKVYALEEGFRIKLVFGKEEVIGERDGWTFSDLQTIMEENPQIKTYVEYFSKQDVLYSCFAKSGIVPLDFDTIKECILFAEEYGKGLPVGEKALLGENVLLVEMGISQPWDIMDFIVSYGDDIVFVGYPREDGRGILHDSGGWSINAASEHKEGAWSFFQFLLDEEHQMKLAEEDSGYFPVLKDAFEKKMEVAETALMQEVFVQEENRYEMQEMARYAVDGVPMYVLPREWTEFVRKLAEESRVFCFEYDYGVWTIVSEEAESFFNNEKDIDEVMAIIKNRMELYLSEKE